MKVTYVRPGKSKGYLTVGLSDGVEKQAFTVSECDYTEAGSPRPGDIADSDLIRALKCSDEIYRAHLYALRILSYADNNERTLVRKLISRGIGSGVAAEVAREMVSRGYINEERQLDRLILSEANRNLSGPRKIRAKLLTKGFAGADIDAAIDRLTDSGEIDFKRSAELLIEKKLTRGATSEEIKQLLYKNGYNIC